MPLLYRATSQALRPRSSASGHNNRYTADMGAPLPGSPEAEGHRTHGIQTVFPQKRCSFPNLSSCKCGAGFVPDFCCQDLHFGHLNQGGDSTHRLWPAVLSIQTHFPERAVWSGLDTPFPSLLSGHVHLATTTYIIGGEVPHSQAGPLMVPRRCILEIYRVLLMVG